MSTLQFTVSNDELFFLILLLQLQVFPGFELDEFRGLKERELELIIDTAERSLRAKGYIRGTEKGVEVDPAVVALVGACSVADISFIVTCTHNDGSTEERYYHIHLESDIIVEHSFPDPDLHTFTELENTHQIATKICAILGIDNQKAPDCPPGRVTESIIDKAKEIVRAGGSAYELLLQAGVPERTALELSTTIAHPITNGAFVRIDHSTEQVHGFATLEGPNGLWKLTREGDLGDEHDNSDSYIQVTPISGTKLKNEVYSAVLS